MYTLKAELWTEVDPYFYHYTPKSRAQVETLKAERIIKDGAFQPSPSPPRLTETFAGLDLYSTHPAVLNLVHCIVTRAAGWHNGAWGAPSKVINDNLISIALHMLV